jgi:hypothetical protein
MEPRESGSYYEETGGFFLEENLNKTLRQRKKVT